MTHEEKAVYRQKEMSEKIKVLIRKAIDGGTNMDRIKGEMASMADKNPDLYHQLIREEATDRLSPGEDNRAFLALLELIEGMDTSSIKQLLKDFENRIEMEKGRREEVFLERLHKRGISGSAVIPNINADHEWRDCLDDLKDTFRKEIMNILV